MTVGFVVASRRVTMTIAPAGAAFSTGSTARASPLTWDLADNNIGRRASNALIRFNHPPPFEVPR